VICRKIEGKKASPEPSPFVKCRVQETQPFKVTGVGIICEGLWQGK